MLWIVCVLAVAGCGGSPGHAPAAAGADVQLVSQTAGGGRTATRATQLRDQAAVDRFVAALEGPLAGKLRAAITESGGPDARLFAQVVAVGCDVPPAATASVGEQVVASPEPVPSPRQECFAPVTTVALVRVPAPAQDGY